MPRDEWKREQQRIDAKRRRSKAPRRGRLFRLPSDHVIPVGTPVLMRRLPNDPCVDPGEFVRYVTQTSHRFNRFVAASRKALLVEHKGWQVWVAKEYLVKP